MDDLRKSIEWMEINYIFIADCCLSAEMYKGNQGKIYFYIFILLSYNYFLKLGDRWILAACG